MAKNYRLRETSLGYNASWVKPPEAWIGRKNLVFAKAKIWGTGGYRVEFYNPAGVLFETKKLGGLYDYEEVIKEYAENYQPQQGEITVGMHSTTALYVVKDDKGAELGYAKFLAYNQKNEAVVEFKNGDIKAVLKEQLEEVIPYTVSVTFTDGGESYAYFAHEGAVKVGDFVIGVGARSAFGLCKVVGVNTKSRGAVKWLEGQKLVGELVGEKHVPTAS